MPFVCLLYSHVVLYVRVGSVMQRLSRLLTSHYSCLLRRLCLVDEAPQRLARSGRDYHEHHHTASGDGHILCGNYKYNNGRYIYERLLTVISAPRFMPAASKIACLLVVASMSPYAQTWFIELCWGISHVHSPPQISKTRHLDTQHSPIQGTIL